MENYENNIFRIVFLSHYVKIFLICHRHTYTSVIQKYSLPLYWFTFIFSISCIKFRIVKLLSTRLNYKRFDLLLDAYYSVNCNFQQLSKNTFIA